MNNIFEHIRKNNSEGGFRPEATLKPTKAQPGSKEKLEIMCERIRNGEELFHKCDLSAAPDILDLSGRALDRRQNQLRIWFRRLWFGDN